MPEFNFGQVIGQNIMTLMALRAQQGREEKDRALRERALDEQVRAAQASEAFRAETLENQRQQFRATNALQRESLELQEALGQRRLDQGDERLDLSREELGQRLAIAELNDRRARDLAGASISVQLQGLEQRERFFEASQPSLLDTILTRTAAGNQLIGQQFALGQQANLLLGRGGGSAPNPALSQTLGRLIESVSNNEDLLPAETIDLIRELRLLMDPQRQTNSRQVR